MTLMVTVWMLAAAANAAAPVAEISIPGEKVYPESITSVADGTLIIGSIGTRTIFRVPPGASSADPWIKPSLPEKQGIFGVFADAKAGMLWACATTPTGPGSQAELFGFDLKTGATKGHTSLPTSGAFCNDIAVGGDGTVYLTDTANMEIVRLKKGGKKLDIWAGNGAFGPKGGVLDGIAVLGDRVIVNTLATNKLFSVPIEKDGKPGKVTEITLDHPIQRPDGMRSYGKNSLLLTESGSPGRLLRITLDGDSGTVRTIKEGYPGGAVSVAAVGTTAYVIEGQLAFLFKRAPADATEKPYHATAVDVGKP
jgi:sugar lactone lactonase YvrE